MNHMTQEMLQLYNVCLYNELTATAILQNIHYTILRGDFIILLGGNGSGKSSLLKIIDQRYQLTSGFVKLCDIDLVKYPKDKFFTDVITLTQNYAESLFTSLTVFENCLLTKQRVANNIFSVSTKNEHDFFAEYLRQFNVNLLAKLDTVVARLSGGEQQALALALSVLFAPQLLLLDEHTSALDPKTSAKLMRLTGDLVKKNGITCILATHDLDIALHYGNKILVLQDGEIYKQIDKTQHAIISKDELLRICY